MVPRRDPVLPDLALIAQLRQEIGGMELRAHGVLPFGVPAIDGHLPGGGLMLGSLHAVSGETGPGVGFVALLAGKLLRRQAGRIVWVSPRPELYGPGLARLGLDPSRLLLVHAPRPADLLWALEEALRTPGIAAAIGEARGIDAVAGRRLQLAAQASGAAGFLLQTGTETVSLPGAVTRWHLAAAPSESLLPGLGPMRWRAELRRCRGAEPAAWLMEEQNEAGSATGGFAVIAEPFDRPHRTPLRLAG